MPLELAAAPDPDTLVGARATVQAALALGTTALGVAGVDSPAAEAEWLLAGALEVGRSRLALQRGRRLAAPDDARYAGMLRRRVAREPLQHILGTQAFRDVVLRVTPAAMVPRPETEVLVEWALALLPPGPRRVVDVGAGTGCIACAIAAERGDATVVALELSPAAAELARANVAALGLAARVTVVTSDVFAALGAVRADLVVANPPYLPTAVIPTLPPEVSRFDPPLALDGGADGLDVVRRLVAQAPDRLVAGGALVLETAGGEQVATVVALMQTAGLVGVQTRADLRGVERFVAGVTEARA
jgi:release factor glutamine methyltransferase